MKKCISIFTLILFIVLSTLSAKNNSALELIIFHAGSLSVPFKEISEAFKIENPDVNIILEAAGSRACARKITDLNRDCDIMASADYTVIDKLLIPDYADWNIKFAKNEMVIAYLDTSKHSYEINTENWYKVLLNHDVVFGRSDPNSDPCGYRAVLTIRLASMFYNEAMISRLMLQKNVNYIRPKETDLLALLESNSLDYIFLYKSVSMQHHLKYIELPDEINLKNEKYIEFYQKAEVKISGKNPHEYITKKGEPMIYGITIIKNAPHYDLAIRFVEFVLNEKKGMEIMLKNGQASAVPGFSDSYDLIPQSLKKYALKK